MFQCENNVVSLSQQRQTVVDEGEQGAHDDDEEDEEHHMVTKTRELAKHVSILRLTLASVFKTVLDADLDS